MRSSQMRVQGFKLQRKPDFKISKTKPTFQDLSTSAPPAFSVFHTRRYGWFRVPAAPLHEPEPAWHEQKLILLGFKAETV